MDKKLKQRLVGASVVTVLAVLIVPEVVKNLNDQKVMGTGEEIESLVAEETESGEHKTTLSLPTPVDKNAEAPQPAVSEAPAQPVDESFSEPAPVTEPIADSNDKPVPIKPLKAVEPPKPPPKPQTTVAKTVDTATSKEQARVTQPQSQVAKVELPAIQLIAKPGVETAAESPSTAPKAWTVQVGSFASQANANLLRDSLRAKNFPAIIEPMTMASGEIRYRVRIGPQTSRAESEAVKNRLQREENLTGDILSL